MPSLTSHVKAGMAPNQTLQLMVPLRGSKAEIKRRAFN